MELLHSCVAYFPSIPPPPRAPPPPPPPPLPPEPVSRDEEYFWSSASDHRPSSPPPPRRSTSHFFTPSHPLHGARASRDAVPLEGNAAASEWHDGLHNSDVVFAASPPPPLELLPQRGSISGGVAQGVSVGAATALLVASLFLGLRSVRRRIKERREAALELTRVT